MKELIKELFIGLLDPMKFNLYLKNLENHSNMKKKLPIVLEQIKLFLSQLIRLEKPLFQLMSQLEFLKLPLKFKISKEFSQI